MQALPMVAVVGDRDLYAELLSAEDLWTTDTCYSSVDEMLKSLDDTPDLIIISDWGGRSGVGVAGVAHDMSRSSIVYVRSRRPDENIDNLPPSVTVVDSCTIDTARQILGLERAPDDIPDDILVDWADTPAQDRPSAPPTDPLGYVSSPVTTDTQPPLSQSPLLEIAGVPATPQAPINPGLSALQLPVQHRGCTTIMVWSTKGGVGKTTIATNLAGAIASMTDLSVCIIDLDTESGDVGSRIDVFRPTVIDILQMPTFTPETLLPVLAHEPMLKLYAVLAPRSGSGGAAQVMLSPGNYDRIFQVLHSMFDVIVLDAPIGQRAPLVSQFALQRADVLLAVIDTERAAVIGLRTQLLEIINQSHYPKERIGLVINQQVGKKDAIPRSDMLEILDHLPVLAEINDDRGAFVGAANQGSLLVNRVGPEGDVMRSHFAALIRSTLPGVEVMSDSIEGVRHTKSSSVRDRDRLPWIGKWLGRR